VKIITKMENVLFDGDVDINERQKVILDNHLSRIWLEIQKETTKKEEIVGLWCLRAKDGDENRKIFIINELVSLSLNVVRLSSQNDKDFAIKEGTLTTIIIFFPNGTSFATEVKFPISQMPILLEHIDETVTQLMLKLKI